MLKAANIALRNNVKPAYSADFNLFEGGKPQDVHQHSQVTVPLFYTCQWLPRILGESDTPKVV